MYVKIEPTGCCTVKDRCIQIRACMYLEPGDPDYEEHHVPDVENHEYPGVVDEEGRPIDEEHYAAWKESIPKRDNPAHNHLYPVRSDATMEEIEAIAVRKMTKAFGQMKRGGKVRLDNKDLRFTMPAKTTATLKAACDTQLSRIHSELCAKTIVPEVSK